MTLGDLAARRPFDPDLEDDMSEVDARKMLDELLSLDDGLSDWEVGFVDDLSKWNGELTDNQRKKLEEVWHRHF